MSRAVARYQNRRIRDLISNTERLADQDIVVAFPTAVVFDAEQILNQSGSMPDAATAVSLGNPSIGNWSLESSRGLGIATAECKIAGDECALRHFGCDHGKLDKGNRYPRRKDMSSLEGKQSAARRKQEYAEAILQEGGCE